MPCTVHVTINVGLFKSIQRKTLRIVKDTKSISKRLNATIEECVAIHNGPKIHKERASPLFYAVRPDYLTLRWQSVDVFVNEAIRQQRRVLNLDVYLIEESRAQCVLAVAMGLHVRLGAVSMIHALSADNVRLILAHLVDGIRFA